MYVLEQLYLNEDIEVNYHCLGLFENMKYVNEKIKEIQENYKDCGIGVYRLLGTKDIKYLKEFLEDNIVVNIKKIKEK